MTKCLVCSALVQHTRSCLCLCFALKRSFNSVQYACNVHCTGVNNVQWRTEYLQSVLCIILVQCAGAVGIVACEVRGVVVCALCIVLCACKIHRNCTVDNCV